MLSFSECAGLVLGFELTQKQVQAFQVYSATLLEWNKKVNLTAITDPEQIETKHFLDSISTVPILREFAVKDVIDIGTGAGFPGIPIKILLPEVNVTLVESIGKKVDFCREVIARLDLHGIQALLGRAEELGQDPDYRERFDVGIARAVAQLDTLAEYLLPLVRLGGKMLAQKGHTGPEEVQKAEHAIRVLGGRVNKLVPVTLPGICEDRYIIIIDKVSATTQKYPRRVGIPGKRSIKSVEK
jgi:16S rRNA (guanine527-N7)-methyltransferase